MLLSFDTRGSREHTGKMIWRSFPSVSTKTLAYARAIPVPKENRLQPEDEKLYLHNIS